MTSPRSGVYTPPPARGSCPSTKVMYATRKQARRAARLMCEPGLRVYRCPRCDWFHVGHVPQRVLVGEVDKAAWLNATQQRGNS